MPRNTWRKWSWRGDRRGWCTGRRKSSSASSAVRSRAAWWPALHGEFAGAIAERSVLHGAREARPTRWGQVKLVVLTHWAQRFGWHLVVWSAAWGLGLASAACSFPEYRLDDAALPDHCRNRIKDGAEADYDCGGDCAPCEAGQSCLVPVDCVSGVCLAGTCAAPSCGDGVKNGRESDVDCGEACTPRRCASGNICAFNEDCNSFQCEQGKCEAAACTDGLKNGAESDVDCGGPNCEPCDTGSVCGADTDCTTRVCSSSRCAPEACRNMQWDADESDVDCGGPSCGPCAGGAGCVLSTDCLSGSCQMSICGAASCTDSVKNQDETDVDCGGAGCAGCADRAACSLGRDCQSGVCAQQTCMTPTCSDFVKNGDETGVDCGGGCLPCATGPECTKNADCTSKVCKSGACAPARCDDGVQNGSESDVDCGQGCALCQIGQKCASKDDCASASCAGRCMSTVHLDLLCSNRDPSPMCIQPYFRVVNTGATALSLVDYTIRYYYTKESGAAESYACYYVNDGDCNQVAPAHFTNLSPQQAGASRYLELSFTANAKSVQPGKYFELEGGFCLAGGATFTQADDYSYTGSSDFQTTPKVALFKSGVLVWGQPP